MAAAEGARRRSGSGRSTDEIKELQQVVADIQQELALHGQMILEVRDGCMELLANREIFAQVLELRDGIQAVMGSARIIAEIGDRTAELDLSLAGVSDNTARHGMAIGKLAEQQRRLTTTMDAAVRAIKRLDRSRSRGCTGSGAPSAAAVSATGTPRTSGFSQPIVGVTTSVVGATNGCELGAGLDQEPLLAPRGWRRPTSAGLRPCAGPLGAHTCDGVGDPAAAVAYCDDGDVEACAGSAGAGTSAEVADCVQGVLARIEEALTKLDGCGPMEQDGGHRAESGSAAATAAPARAPESWDPSQRNIRGCRGTRRAASARRPASRTPQATAHVTPCGDDGRYGALGDTPRIFSTGRGYTPRSQRPASGSAALSPRQYVDRLTSRGTSWRYPEVWA